MINKLPFEDIHSVKIWKLYVYKNGDNQSLLNK